MESEVKLKCTQCGYLTTNYLEALCPMCRTTLVLYEPDEEEECPKKN